MPNWGPVETNDGTKRMARIVSVDLPNMTAYGVSQQEGTTDILLKHMPSGMVLIPQIGEEWVIERHWDTWVLAYRSDWQNTLFYDLAVGDTKLGGKRLILSGDRVEVNSAASYEASATLSSGITGFVKYQTSPTGEVFCWGEVGFAATSGSAFKNIATLANLPEGVIVRPSSRRNFAGIATGTSNTYAAAMMQMQTDGRITLYTNGDVPCTGLSFSTSWFVRQ